MAKKPTKPKKPTARSRTSRGGAKAGGSIVKPVIDVLLALVDQETQERARKDPGAFLDKYKLAPEARKAILDAMETGKGDAIRKLFPDTKKHGNVQVNIL